MRTTVRLVLKTYFRLSQSRSSILLAEVLKSVQHRHQLPSYVVCEATTNILNGFRNFCELSHSQ